jgi:HEAT repeat protein
MMSKIMLWWTLQKLKSKSAGVRRQAVEQLGASADPQYLGNLSAMLGDADTQVRVAVVAALGKIKSPAVAGVLVRLLADREAAVRAAALAAFREARPPGAEAALLAGLIHPEGAVRHQALNALEALGWQPKDDTQRICTLVASGRFGAAALSGVPALRPLAAVLHSSNGRERRAALEALGQIADPAVAPLLKAALQDPDSGVRRAGIEALVRSGDAGAAEALKSRLTDSEPQVRAAAIAALAALSGPSAVEAILGALRDGHWEVRSAAAAALGRLRDRQAVKPLQALLRDEDEDVRRTASEALALLGDPAAIEPLVLALADEQPSVRNAVLVALRRINFFWETTPEAQRVLPQLRVVAETADYWGRQSVLQAIEKITKASSPAAGANASARNLPQSQAAVEAFLEALGSDHPDVRLAAADALGRLGDAGNIHSLVQTMRDPDPGVCVAAAQSLSMLGWQPGDEFQQARQAKLLRQLAPTAHPAHG